MHKQTLCISFSMLNNCWPNTAHVTETTLTCEATSISHFRNALTDPVQSCIVGDIEEMHLNQ